MRISFSNISIPTRAAKRIKDHLSIKESEARRVTALVLGYRSWADLNQERGTAVASPLDEECDTKALDERRRYQAQKLRESAVALGERGAEEVISWWQPSAGHPQAPVATKTAPDKRRNPTLAKFAEALLILDQAPGQKAAPYEDVLLHGIQQCAQENMLNYASIIAARMLSGERPREPELARRMLEALVAKGQPVAILNLTVSLMTGDGGPKDVKRAGDLLELVANDESVPSNLRAEARSRLGTVLAGGMERRTDPVKALKLWEEAAQAGDLTAAYNAGCAYQDGIGVRQNIEKAVEVFRSAADAGHVDSSNNLGILLMTRPDLALHLDEAEERLIYAAENGSENAKGALRQFNRELDSIMRDFDAGRLPEHAVRAVQNMIVDMAMGGGSMREMFKDSAPAQTSPTRQRTRKRK